MFGLAPKRKRLNRAEGNLQQQYLEYLKVNKIEFPKPKNQSFFYDEQQKLGNAAINVEVQACICDYFGDHRIPKQVAKWLNGLGVSVIEDFGVQKNLHQESVSCGYISAHIAAYYIDHLNAKSVERLEGFSDRFVNQADFVDWNKKIVSDANMVLDKGSKRLRGRTKSTQKPEFLSEKEVYTITKQVRTRIFDKKYSKFSFFLMPLNTKL